MSTKEEKEKRAAYMRKYNKTEKGAAYNRKHAHEWRKKTKVPHSKNRISRSKEYREIIIDVLLKRDGDHCGFCNKSLADSKVHIDYIIPVAFGGPNTMENVRLAHDHCNFMAGLEVRQKLTEY